MEFVIWCLDLAISDFALQTLFLVSEQVAKKSILLAYFRDKGKQNFYMRGPCSSIFFIPEPCQRSPLYNPH